MPETPPSRCVRAFGRNHVAHQWLAVCGWNGRV